MLCNDCGQVMQQVFPRPADPTSSDAFDLLLSGAAGYPSTSPIFVVGMPRSGSTLVEHILSSHPQAHGAGMNTGYCAYLVKHPPPLGATPLAPLLAVQHATSNERCSQTGHISYCKVMFVQTAVCLVAEMNKEASLMKWPPNLVFFAVP